MTAARILVTGSRNWVDPDRIESALVDAWQEVADTDPVVLVTGACPTGADRIAETIWASWNLPIERHPADWNRHGRAAGPIRNIEMVNLGADMCLAFIRQGSRGASMTADRAEEAGIETRRFVEVPA